MNEQELQLAFLQFLAQKSGAKNQQELEKYVQSLGEEGLQQAYLEFAQLMQQQAQKAAHGAKLQYFKFLKNQCAEDEELYYYKKGGSIGCGCKKKKEDGGEIKKAKCGSAVSEFKAKRMEIGGQTPKKKYTKDQIAGREPVKVVNGVKYFLNGDGQIVKDPKGRLSSKLDPKTTKKLPNGKYPSYWSAAERGAWERKYGSEANGILEEKCGSKLKKHQQGARIVGITPEEAELINNRNKNIANLYIHQAPTIGNLFNAAKYAYKGYINPVEPNNGTITGTAPIVGGIKYAPKFSLLMKRVLKTGGSWLLPTKMLKVYTNWKKGKPISELEQLNLSDYIEDILGYKKGGNLNKN